MQSVPVDEFLFGKIGGLGWLNVRVLRFPSLYQNLIGLAYCHKILRIRETRVSNWFWNLTGTSAVLLMSRLLNFEIENINLAASKPRDIFHNNTFDGFVDRCPGNRHIHYCDVIMGTMASQITSITIVYSTVYSGTDQRKHQSSASLAFVWGNHRWPVNSPHKWPVTRKMLLFDDVIMILATRMPVLKSR